MIYYPYVLIKLFRQSYSEKEWGRENGERGKEQLIQIRRQIEEGRKQGWIWRQLHLEMHLERTKSPGDRTRREKGSEYEEDAERLLMSCHGELMRFHLLLAACYYYHLSIYCKASLYPQLTFFLSSVCFAASWTTTTSAVLKMELSERYVTWKYCEYLFIQLRCWK